MRRLIGGGRRRQLAIGRVQIGMRDRIGALGLRHSGAGAIRSGMRLRRQGVIGGRRRMGRRGVGMRRLIGRG